MGRRLIFPILALVGALFALVIVFWSQREKPVQPILFPPPTSPFANSIAGAGIIEAGPQNIGIGTPFNEIVTDIFVTVGQYVKKGDPLFKLDTRLFEAAKDTAEAGLKLSRVQLEDRETQFSFYERLVDKRAVSEQAYQQARYAVLEAAEAVAVSLGQLEEAEANIERSLIRAPSAGQILQVNVRPGELAPVITNFIFQTSTRLATQGTIMLMGCTSPLQVRIDIDEDDCWRFREGAASVAFVRGNSTIHFPLQFVRVEPYVVPKSSFTGETVERVDTRVLQVIYQFDKCDLPVYAGQVLDIFIESEPIENFVRK